MTDEMTVGELQDALEDVDPDAKVHLHASGGFVNLRTVEEQEVTWNTGDRETVVSLL